MQLIAIDRNGRPEDFAGRLDSQASEVLGATAGHYRRAGFAQPWISYLAVVDDAPIGICSFKTAPVDGRVEIAYFTFPPHEGKGFATEMARQLLAIASRHDDGIVVTAQTLTGRNASHRVLEKLGFVPTGIIDHPEDGKILDWQLERNRVG